MIGKNNKISAFQFAVIAAFIATSFFEGTSSVILYNEVSQDAWISALFTTLLSIPFFYVLMKIFNYEPNKNVIEKVNHLFPNPLGFILNGIIILSFIVMLLILTWSLFNFTIIKYLTETPPFFICAIIVATAGYTVFKGIEAIGRVATTLLYFAILAHIITSLFLIRLIDLDNIKPFLEDGISPIFSSSFHFLLYTTVPFIVMMIIPKKNVSNPRKIKKYFFIGFILSIFSTVWMLFVTIGVIGTDLAELYRFPSYYTMKKVTFAGVFENLENFLALLFLISSLVLIILIYYFISESCKTILPIRKNNGKKLTIILIGTILTIATPNLFSKTSDALHFIKNIYPFASAIPLLMVMIILYIKIITYKTKIKQKEI